MSRTPRPTLSRRAGFWVAAGSLVLIFATSGAAIPLFGFYRARAGIDNGDLGWASAGYFTAAAVALLVLGRLSDHRGRRPVALAALVSSALSCLALLHVDGAAALLLARALQGLACGLGSSALGAYLVDAAPPRPRWLAPAIAGSAPMIGIPIGALSSGALAQYGPAPTTLVFEIGGALLVAACALLSLSPETTTRRDGALRSMRPRLLVVPGTGRAVVAVGAAFVATWSMGGFYQAFGPSVVAERLGTTSPLLAGAVFASVMILTPVSSPCAGVVSPAFALRIGMLLFVAAVVAIVVSLGSGAAAPFIAASLLVGVAQGVANTGGLRELLASTPAHDRGGVLSTIFLIGYCGAALPGMVAGRAAHVVDAYTIAIAYATLGVLSAVVALAAGGRARPGPSRPRG